MEFSKAILGFVWFFVLVPLLMSAVFLLTVGGSAAVAMAIPLLALVYVVTPVFRMINVVPVLGRVVTSVFSVAIGLGLAAWFLFEFCMPMLVIVYHAMTGEGTLADGTLFMQFCDKYLRWAMEWCELKTVVPGWAVENDLPTMILKLLVMFPFLTGTLAVPWGCAFGSLVWGLRMVVKPGKPGDA